MGLREYHRKRDFAITPEPRGEELPERAGARSFCIQKHAASHLHYDFRLEMEGVLKSWAVPKGPSFDPADKRLAMMTEDHPIDYGDFEGIIPEGEYGGGTVLLWDTGTWEPIEDPHKGLRAGSLKFRLSGKKLQGRWALVKIKGRDARDDAKSWLLIKEKDEFVRPASEWSVVEARPESVTTGRTLDEIAREKDRVWHSNREDGKQSGKPKRRAAPAARRSRSASVDVGTIAGAVPGARKRAAPKAALQLATLVDAAPKGDQWLHEMKFDGYRIAAELAGGTARLMSRNGKDWTAQFPSVAEDVERLPAKTAILDGEVAVVQPDGTTSFQALQNAMTGSGGGELVYFVFDLLYLEGHDLTGATLEDRKQALARLLKAGPSGSSLRFSDHVTGDGDAFFQNACRLGLEGIISKRRDARYEGGRGKSWLKVKCLKRQEFVIGGYTDPEGSRVGIGALLLGVQDGGGLEFAGKVGTGFTSKTLADLQRRLEPLGRPASPFKKARIPGVTRAHWVDPKLVAEVAFTEWTSDGRLRHPSFQGLREDKKAKDVVREKAVPVARAAAAEPAAEVPRPARGRSREGEVLSRKAGSRSRAGKEAVVAGVKLTNADRVVFDGPGATKLDVAHYYEAMAGRILPYVVDRPLTLVRGPEGASKPTFYMKHSGVWAPAALRRVKIQEKTKIGEYLVVDDLPGLIALVQMGILEIHTWNSTAKNMEKPDRIVFDLDPDPSVGWPAVVQAAHLVRARLEQLDLDSFVKTTGGKGVHVVVPLSPGSTWEDSFEFSRGLSEQIERADPRHFTTVMPKAARKGRILIDFLRNNRGNTSVAPYSTRAKPAAPLSVPITWEELTPALRPDQFTLANIDERLRKQKKDPWADYLKVKQRLTAAARKAVGA
jgi:bifunctional non-homologous end joining protein LigD